jgi:transcriptional regulator with XRE-family HTH domain
MGVTGPTLARRRLGKELRRMREASGKSIQDVVNSKIAAKNTLWRIETGTAPIAVATSRALAQLYGADQATIERIGEHAARTQERGWWQRYAPGLRPGFVDYIGLESDAAEIRMYGPELVPGILQTADYARAVELGTHLAPEPEAVERNVEARIERQRAAMSRQARVVVVLNEGALERQIGGREVLTRQILHLQEAASLPHVEVRVLAWQSGAHVAVRGSFVLLDFADANDPPIAYVETYVGAHYLEDSQDVELQREIFRRIYQQSIPLEEHIS